MRTVTLSGGEAMGRHGGPKVCGELAARNRRMAGPVVMAAVGLLALGLVTPVVSSRPASAAPPGFVTRDGTRLRLDGGAYRFTGLNIYNANSNGWCWYSMGGTVLDDSLAAIGPGKSAFRSWFFQQLATNGGARDWSAFDHTLATARARGVKVIATLIDQWGNCGSAVPGGYKDARASPAAPRSVGARTHSASSVTAPRRCACDRCRSRPSALPRAGPTSSPASRRSSRAATTRARS